RSPRLCARARRRAVLAFRRDLSRRARRKLRAVGRRLCEAPHRRRRRRHGGGAAPRQHGSDRRLGIAPLPAEVTGPDARLSKPDLRCDDAAHPYRDRAVMSRASQILFIVGMPRSGTKLLRDLLNRHPDVAIFPNESHFFPRMPALIEKHGDPRRRERFARLYAELEGTRFMRRIRADGISIERDDWFARIDGGGARDVLKALFACYAAMTGRRIVGDKTPEYLTEVPVLSGF